MKAKVIMAVLFTIDIKLIVLMLTTYTVACSNNSQTKKEMGKEVI